eukprot:6291760-Amphidinium_carterae.1
MDCDHRDASRLRWTDQDQVWDLTAVTYLCSNLSVYSLPSQVCQRWDRQCHVWCVIVLLLLAECCQIRAAGHWLSLAAVVARHSQLVQMT